VGDGGGRGGGEGALEGGGLGGGLDGGGSGSGGSGGGGLGGASLSIRNEYFLTDIPSFANTRTTSVSVAGRFLVKRTAADSPTAAGSSSTICDASCI
jgi:hypothetical protein